MSSHVHPSKDQTECQPGRRRCKAQGEADNNVAGSLEEPSVFKEPDVLEGEGGEGRVGATESRPQ